MGTQAASTQCGKAAPTNALTSRSSELFETSLCQGEDIIRQVQEGVGPMHDSVFVSFDLRRISGGAKAVSGVIPVGSFPVSAPT
jgi:hypothetical protein